MKTLRKKVLTVCLALMMAVVMAVPAFAAEITPYADIYHPYHIRASASTNRALYGSGFAVSLSAYDASSANQDWTIGRYNGTLKLYANMTIGTGNQMVLTYAFPLGPVILDGEGGLPWGQSIDFHTTGTNKARIYFDQCDYYLQANTTYTDVVGANYAEQNNDQIWLLS